jgi:DNA gyrase subunit B
VLEFSWRSILVNRLRELAFLNKGLVITLIDERDERRENFYEGGIREFVEHINRKQHCTSHPIFVSSAGGEGAPSHRRGEIALQWTDAYVEQHLLLRQQHQHHRGRHAPLSASAPR